MNELSRIFVKTSSIYLAIGTVIGVLITIGSGKRLFSKKLGFIHFWLGNIGVVGLALSYPFMRMYVLKGKDFSDALFLVTLFGLIVTISIFMFIYNIWKSIGNTNDFK